MAEIKPFRALHYNPSTAGDLNKLVTQPYDKITPEMQAGYYAASLHNLARIIRRRPDPAEPDPYAAAARDFRGWIRDGILTPADLPGLYPYDQEYAVPGQPGVRKRRRGFIGLCRLEDYSAGVVYRHEETLSGPKADRLALLSAARAHFGQIFFLYSDPEGDVERAVAEATRSLPVWEQVVDEHQTKHEVWNVTDGAAQTRIADLMRGKKLVIADGHHRYETALAYRNSERAAGRGGGSSEYLMATFVRMESDGLIILPTHRVVHGLREFNWPELLAASERYFAVNEMTGTLRLDDVDSIRRELAEAGRDGPAFLAVSSPNRAAMLTLRSDVPAARLEDAPAGLRRLDVFVLHRLLLERVLGIDPAAVREERNLHYERDMSAAIQAVTEGRAQVCFLVNPTAIEEVRDNALAGQAMSQKSTDFYPKLLSGLTIFDLEI